MLDVFRIPRIRLFVFGTLRMGGKFEYYMEGTENLGLHYTRGQLMQTLNRSAFINFEVTNALTIGELHLVNYYCLQRIHHLESNWGEFPKAYDLDLIPVWPNNQKEFALTDDNPKDFALCYIRREESVIPGGDWKNRKDIIKEIGLYLNDKSQDEISEHGIVAYIQNYLKS